MGGRFRLRACLWSAVGEFVLLGSGFDFGFAARGPVVWGPVHLRSPQVCSVVFDFHNDNNQKAASGGDAIRRLRV